MDISSGYGKKIHYYVKINGSIKVTDVSREGHSNFYFYFVLKVLKGEEHVNS